MTSSILLDGLSVTSWTYYTGWDYAIATMRIGNGEHRITSKSGDAVFGAYAYGHSLMDDSSSAYGYTASFRSRPTFIVRAQISRDYSLRAYARIRM